MRQFSGGCGARHGRPQPVGGNLWALALVLAGWLSAATSAWGQAPQIGSAAAVLMDSATGRVFFDQAMHQRRPVASTTKIMTALIALQSASLDDTVVIGEDAVKVESPGLDFRPGETLTLGDLLTALLLKSSNAAAVAIADHAAGSVGVFAQRMNQRARSLGAVDTHFVNPHGLYALDHYSSAYDLALITREAMKYPRFRELVAEKVAEIRRPLIGTAETVENHNKLLWRAGCVDGVKTGFVKESGQCLVASATRNGWQLIAVVLDSPDTYGEALQLLDYGFAIYRQQVFARRGDAVGRAPVRFGHLTSVPAICEQPLTQVTGPGLAAVGLLQVKLNALRAPIGRGAVVGEAQVLAGGQVIARSRLLAAESVPRSRLIVAANWALRLVVLLAVAGVGIRTGAKLIKDRRRRWRRLPPQGGRPDPGGPGQGQRRDGDQSGLTG